MTRKLLNQIAGVRPANGSWRCEQTDFTGFSELGCRFYGWHNSYHRNTQFGTKLVEGQCASRIAGDNQYVIAEPLLGVGAQGDDALNQPFIRTGSVGKASIVHQIMNGQRGDE